MKLLFMGTPDFAVFSLDALVQAGHEVVGVVTQPDKPKGRGYTLTPPPVKIFAAQRGIPVYQPVTLKDESFAELLRGLEPQVIAVVAYGKILPQWVLDFPPLGCINVHGSLLPEYRGAAPMQRAILDGKTVSGVTTQYMAAGVDTGDMLLWEEVAIGEEDDFEAVHDKLGACGASLLIRSLSLLESGTAPRIPQDESRATYAPKIQKEDCLLDFFRDSFTVHNQIRGLSPFPLAFTHTPDGRLLKVTRAERISDDTLYPTAGQVLSLEGGITVACGRGSVRILGVLPEGKSRMTAEDFVRGRKVSLGDILS